MAMNRFVSDNGKEAAVYAVCVQLWLLVTFSVVVLAVIALFLGVHHSTVRIVSWCIWGLFAGGSFMSLLRFWHVRSARRRFLTGSGET